MQSCFLDWSAQLVSVLANSEATPVTKLNLFLHLTFLRSFPLPPHLHSSSPEIHAAMPLLFASLAVPLSSELAYRTGTAYVGETVDSP